MLHNMLTECSDAGPMKWSSEGMSTKVLEDGHVRCLSHHLTSFAVLLSATAGVEIAVCFYSVKREDVTLTFLQNNEVLQVLSKIALSFSLFCLLLAIVFFITYG